MRYQLPVKSPLPLGAVLAGIPALVSDGARAAERVSALLRERVGARDVLLLDGGTSALSLAIRGVLAEAPDRPVALPAYGCFDVATAAEAAGAQVVLYDTDPATLGPDARSLESALAARPCAVVFAHLYGVPVDIPRWAEAVRAAGALLIEDAAQGAGGALGGRVLGSFGDVSVLSFGRGKGVTGGGAGALAALTERGGRVLASARAGLLEGGAGARELAALAAQWLLGRPGLYWLPASLPFLRLGETIYRPPHAASCAPRACLRVLERTWPLAVAEAETRCRNASRLLRHAGRALRPVAPPAGAEPGYLRLPMVASPAARSRIARGEARALGVLGGYPIPLSELPSLAPSWANRDADLGGAQLLAQRLVTIPTHSDLGESDLCGLERWMERMNGAER